MYSDTGTDGVDPAASDLAQAAQMALDEVPFRRATSVFAAYDEVLAWGTESCPTIDSSGVAQYWTASCTTAQGAWFNGFAHDYQFEDTALADGSLITGRAIRAVAEVTTPESGIQAGGVASEVATLSNSGGYVAYVSSVAGDFRYDGALDLDEWITSDQGADLEQTYVWYVGASGGPVATLTGSIDIPGEFTHVAFDGFTMAGVQLAPDCQEPGGWLAVRRSDGRWFDIGFDGPSVPGEEVEPTLCYGCGSAWHNGVELGAACVDAAALVSWSVSPW